MDRIALEILRQGLRKDAEVLRTTVETAQVRLDDTHPGHLEACGYRLNRAYNILEKAFERICLAFENHFEKGNAYHGELIERMTLELPGIRPRFLPPAHELAVKDLKGFRHVFRHAYELELRKDQMESVMQHARSINQSFSTWCEDFLSALECDTEP